MTRCYAFAALVVQLVFAVVKLLNKLMSACRPTEMQS